MATGNVMSLCWLAALQATCADCLAAVFFDNFKGLQFCDLRSNSGKGNRRSVETILYIVLNFQVDCACLQRKSECKFRWESGI